MLKWKNHTYLKFWCICWSCLPLHCRSTLQRCVCPHSSGFYISAAEVPPHTRPCPTLTSISSNARSWGGGPAHTRDIDYTGPLTPFPQGHGHFSGHWVAVPVQPAASGSTIDDIKSSEKGVFHLEGYLLVSVLKELHLMPVVVDATHHSPHHSD